MKKASSKDRLLRSAPTSDSSSEGTPVRLHIPSENVPSPLNAGVRGRLRIDLVDLRPLTKVPCVFTEPQSWSQGGRLAGGKCLLSCSAGPSGTPGDTASFSQQGGRQESLRHRQVLSSGPTVTAWFSGSCFHGQPRLAPSFKHCLITAQMANPARDGAASASWAALFLPQSLEEKDTPRQYMLIVVS